MKTQLWKKKFKARTRLSGLDIKSIVIVARACLEKVNTLLGFNALVFGCHISRTSNIAFLIGWAQILDLDFGLIQQNISIK